MNSFVQLLVAGVLVVGASACVNHEELAVPG